MHDVDSLDRHGAIEPVGRDVGRGGVLELAGHGRRRGLGGRNKAHVHLDGAGTHALHDDVLYKAGEFACGEVAAQGLLEANGIERGHIASDGEGGADARELV